MAAQPTLNLEIPPEAPVAPEPVAWAENGRPEEGEENEGLADLPAAPLPALNVEFLSPRGSQNKRRQRRSSVSAEADNRRSPNSLLKKAQQRMVVPKSFETKQRIEQALSTCLLVSSLTADQRQDIIDAMSEQRVKAGDSIITQGEDGDYFYVIDSGRFLVFKRNPEDPDKEDSVFEYNESGSFGELALLYNCPRAATVRAATDGVVWRLDRETFKQIVVANAMARRSELDQVIRQLEFFGNMDHEQLSHLTDSVQYNQTPAGEMILRQGERGNLFYIITEGDAVVTVRHPDAAGAPVVVNRLKKGDYFGEIALLRGVERQASVVAGPTGCSFVTMDHSTFMRVLDQAQIQTLTERMGSYRNSPVEGDSDEDEKADEMPRSPPNVAASEDPVAGIDEVAVATPVDEQTKTDQSAVPSSSASASSGSDSLSLHLRMLAYTMAGLLAGLGVGMMLMRSVRK